MHRLATKSEFAREIGKHRSYVTRLAQSDRLVLAKDGKRVDVDASKKRIKETEDPNRDDVRKRHATTRDAKPPATTAKPGSSRPQPTPEDPEIKRVSRSFNASRADKEHYLAQTARLEYERATGKVVDTEAVQHAGSEAGAAIRARLENIADQLAPQLAPVTDETEVRRILDDHIEGVLTELANKLSGLSVAITSKGAVE